MDGRRKGGRADVEQKTGRWADGGGWVADGRRMDGRTDGTQNGGRRADKRTGGQVRGLKGPAPRSPLHSRVPKLLALV